MTERNFYLLYGKRAFDIVVALMIGIMVLPVVLIAIICVRITMGSPVFFTQKRVGLNEKEFQIYKIRSMTNKTDEHGVLLPKEQRSNWFGTLIRKASIDELPQIVNVIKGDMSLIGPRPLLPRYLPYYHPTERLRHSVRPGVTGLAQISGRNALSWDSKLSKDVEYVRGLNPLLDLKILIETFKKVFLREDVVAPSGTLDLEKERAQKKGVKSIVAN